MTDEMRLTELEIKIAFQEDTVKALSDVIYQQQNRIDRLETLLPHYQAQLDGSIHEFTGAPAIDDKPPHY